MSSVTWSYKGKGMASSWDPRAILLHTDQISILFFAHDRNAVPKLDIRCQKVEILSSVTLLR